MENVFKGKVSELPMEGRFYVTDISYFNKMTIYYCNHNSVSKCDKYSPWFTSSSGINYYYSSSYFSHVVERYKQVDFAVNYQNCSVSRFFENRTIDISCLISDIHTGMQVVDCKKEGVIILQPSWSGDILYASSDMLSQVKELTGICANSSENELSGTITDVTIDSALS